MKSSSTVLHDTNEKTSHIIRTPLHLWNYETTGISQKPICTNNQGPLHESAVLYNGRMKCHHKHNYSRFPTQKEKGKNNDITNQSDQFMLVLTTQRI